MEGFKKHKHNKNLKSLENRAKKGPAENKLEDFLSLKNNKEKSLKSPKSPEILENKIDEKRKDIFNKLGKSERLEAVKKHKESLSGENLSEVSKEFVDQIILNENIRYQSLEALNRAKRIDKDFPAGAFEKTFNKYKKQENNLKFVNSNPSVHIGDWLEEGEGGHYRQQPPLVSRSKDFIQLTSKANPEQAGQILSHEYNHMITQGESNFSGKYKKYLKGMFLSEKEIDSFKDKKEYEILFREAYKGSGPIYKYLTSPAEVNAYLGTNLRNDLLRNKIIKDFYSKIDENTLNRVADIKDSNCNREKTPIYKIYFSILKDKEKLISWLNNYAI
ncbi:MAG: hypothetical protein ABH951_02215 [Patescibacteria group bacterium]